MRATQVGMIEMLRMSAMDTYPWICGKVEKRRGWGLVEESQAMDSLSDRERRDVGSMQHARFFKAP